jgi:hypothetical protein
MKKRKRIIFIITFILIYIWVAFFFLPRESEHYLKSDIDEFENSLVIISAIVSFIVLFLGVFDKKRFTEKKTSKIIYIGFIGIMSYFLFQQNSKIVTAIGLYSNRLSSDCFLTKEFIVNFKMDNKPYVLGRLKNKYYDTEIDKVELKQTEFDKVTEKATIVLKFKKGMLGIPFDPIKKE